MRIERAVLVLLGTAVLCWLLGNAGCNSATLTGNNGGGMPPQSNAVPGVDWAMSLTAGGTTGAEMFPAKFTFDINAAPDCTNDYVVFNTSLTNPSIVAFNQLYSTQGSVGGFCNQNGPSVMWSYNTKPAGDTTGTAVTSPVLSGDGTKVAYVETRTAGNGGAILHVLKWKAGQGTIASPVAPDTTLAGGAGWSTCPAANSCLVNITFSGGQPDTNSSPFYNYSNDTLYVGDNNGVLHKFTGVFNGTPAEVTTAPWPITVHSATVLSSPVVDSGSGNIFLGDASGQLSYVREVGSTAGTCASGSPPCLGSTNIALGGAITDAPIVDSSAGRVFVFDGTALHGTDVGVVVQVTTALGTQVTVDVGGTQAGSANDINSGAFDDAYLSGSFTTGHLFVCGMDPAKHGRPAIHRIGFASSGQLNATSDGSLTLSGVDFENCSPVTELKNGATDRIFFSVAANANQTGAGCTNSSTLGCIMSLDLGGTWPPAAVTHGVPTSGGTSGIVVDNVSGSTQASSIYFSYLSNAATGATCNGATGVGCAVKLTQSAFQ